MLPANSLDEWDYLSKNSVFKSCTGNLAMSILVLDICRTRVLGELEMFRQVPDGDPWRRRSPPWSCSDVRLRWSPPPRSCSEVWVVLLTHCRPRTRGRADPSLLCTCRLPVSGPPCEFSPAPLMSSVSHAFLIALLSSKIRPSLTSTLHKPHGLIKQSLSKFESLRSKFTSLAVLT